MIEAPVIYPIDDPVSSLNVHIEGSGSIDTSGFVFSPSGGVFASGAIASGFSWSYDFRLMSESEVFSIASLDASGNVSPSASVTINYELQPPIILSPGQPKSIEDNVASSGSTENTFLTLSGDFKNDGVIVGDYALAINGKNVPEIRKILQVEDNYLITEPFPYAWEQGDEIKIYNDRDRQTYHANKLYFQSTGIVDESAEDVLYTSGELQPITVYAELEENYNIDFTNDTLHFIIDGTEAFITLTHGSGRTAQEIVDEINAYFPVDVAFIEQISILEPAVFYIIGIKVEVFDTPGAQYFKICRGKFLFADTMAATGTIGTDDDCHIVLQEDDSRTIDLNIDGNIVRVTLPEQEELNPQSVADALNEQAGKCIASAGTSSVTILAENQLNVNQDLPYLGLDKGISGRANLSKNEGNPDADFNFDFTIFQNDFTVKVIAEDPFGNRSDASELPVNYQIDPPVLSQSLQELLDNSDTGDQLESNEDVFTLQGNFDPEGDSVVLNNETIFTSSDVWSEDVPLLEGENNIELKTVDIFGTPSNATNLNVNYTNPDNQPAIAGSIPPVGGLRWRSVTTPSFSNSDVENVMNAVDSVFGPVTGFLDTVSSVLKLVRAFIVDNVASFVNVVKNAVQNFVDQILGTLNDFVNGAGIFILSTIPKASDVAGPLDFFQQIQVPFNQFVETLIRSFDDPLDPYRPQLSENITAGGYVLAIADTGGILDFMESLKQIQQIVEKEVLDYALSYPKNLKISNENQRCVLTWTSPDGIRPGGYTIKRARVAGGKPTFKDVKTNIPKPGQPNFRKERDIDENTGEFLTEYEIIGEIVDLQVLKEFRFIDGKVTAYEAEQGRVSNDITTQQNQTNVDSDTAAKNTRNFLDRFRDSILVNQASTEKDLINGETYYYKVIPTYFGESEVGQSFELIGTPQIPELEYVEEFLNEQIGKTDPTTGTKGIRYVLSGAIFDKNKGTFASEPVSSHLQVLVDGGRITPTNVVFNKGLVYIREEDIPSSSIKFSYWTKKPINATRAKLTGKNQGDFTFKKNDPDGNTMAILVGPKSSSASNLGTGTEGASTISLEQKITFVRDFGDEEETTLTSDQVANIIRNQTSGLKVAVDKKNRIILIDDQNPNPYVGSRLQITDGTAVLGFSDTANDPTVEGGGFNYLSEAGVIGGVPPDWFRVSVADLFPILNDMMRYIDNTTQNFLRSLESATNALTEFIDLLVQKVETLNDIAKRIQELIKDAANILTVKGGFWLLEIPGRPGGNEWLKEALATSIGRPNSDFTAGVMFVYGDGATQTAIDFLFKPIR